MLKSINDIVHHLDVQKSEPDSDDDDDDDDNNEDDDDDDYSDDSDQRGVAERLPYGVSFCFFHK